MEITKEARDYFKDQNVVITLFPESKKRKFTKIEAFIEFIVKEKKYWDFATNGRLNSIRNHFCSIHNDLELFKSQGVINVLVGAINKAKMNSIPCIYSETADGQLLKLIYLESPEQAHGAYEFIYNKSLASLSNYNHFIGILRAFQLRNKQDKTEIIAEKEALSSLRASFNEDLTRLSGFFSSKVDEVTDNFNSIQQELDVGKKECQAKFDDLINGTQQRIIELDELFREKLRLEGPAKYWHDLYTDYQTKGKDWRSWAIGSTISLMAVLIGILYNLPDALFESFNINSIKTTIVFALISSVGIYLIRFFVLLSTSAFHLSRDAYERYQLTHVYLSLLHEKGVGSEERNIVLQSIFSRADTGLLKGDSSPAFPDSVLGQIIKNMKSK